MDGQAAHLVVAGALQYSHRPVVEADILMVRYVLGWFENQSVFSADLESRILWRVQQKETRGSADGDLYRQVSDFIAEKPASTSHWALRLATARVSRSGQSLQ